MRSVESPCTGVCRLDSTGAFCLGCKRTLDEIADWPMLTDAGKRTVLEAVKQRS
ncbi:MAG: DUF1289 domain-containing protein [Novosphingobium sp.]